MIDPKKGWKGVPQNIFNGNDRLFRGTTWWGIQKKNQKKNKKAATRRCKVCDMEKWTGFRGRNLGSKVARAKWPSSADSLYNLQ